MSHDVVLVGGRVIDPETGLDGVYDVGIDGGSVTTVGEGLDGATTIDVGGLVVAPGFVDLHSHAQTLPGRRLQACDGVTTALDLEAGRAPVEVAYEREAERGSPINYGFSASWAAARMHVLADGPLDGGAAAIFGGLAGTEWQRAATAASWRGSSTRSQPTSPPARSASACSSVTRLESIRPSTSRWRSWRPQPGCRPSHIRVTSSSWLRRR